MSEENVEIVRRAIEVFRSGMERGDPGAAFDLESASDDFELITVPFEGRTVWRGREGWVEFIRVWTKEFDDWSLQIERQIDAGDDRVVSLMHQSGTGKQSGVPVDLDFGQIHELKDGHVIRIRVYPSHAEALEAAGLSE
jgi:ketosteroid isomerase-like protein